ncbi:hypothetical protein QFC21_000723 [Naganishia friedmannii]|uniref:Uncharacterized protein n=1 Tax=Naganishia friedmannii TaxID=89922 RepID=A0ACC2W8V0_9TREE|nr:hypothetical protein QFC21_000723 [Naganishia friedmannii]
MLVELKNGETYNGHMIACDNFMNVTLRDVILTSPEGDKFYQMKEVYLKGNVGIAQESRWTSTVLGFQMTLSVGNHAHVVEGRVFRIEEGLLRWYFDTLAVMRRLGLQGDQEKKTIWEIDRPRDHCRNAGGETDEISVESVPIKYVRVADQILDKVQEDQHRIREQNRHSGGGGGRGGGGGDRGGMRGGRGGGGGGFRGKSSHTKSFLDFFLNIRHETGGPNRGGGAPRGGRGGPGRGGAPGGNRGGRGSFNGNGP